MNGSSDVPQYQQDAGAPFDDGDADIIIRSSDGVDFRIYKNILTKASRGFADMFSARPVPANPPTDKTDPNYKDGLPIISLSENSRDLRLFFEWLYPMDNPDLSKPTNLAAVLALIQKYVVDGYPKAIESVLLALVARVPQSAYALACRYQYPQIARAAAKESLKFSAHLSFNDLELAHLSTKQLYALTKYRDDCLRRAFVESHEYDTWAPHHALPYGEDDEDPPCSCPTSDDTGERLPGWFKTHVGEYRTALERCPHPSTLSQHDFALPPKLMTEAAVCPRCTGYLKRKSLESFRYAFAARLDEVYDKVPLNIMD
ncbi:hypothetical protein DENSPDRAFT_835936 [Dentipellis sp. KUC8613]|nr:hypothetical protein DENSPDRAFT_835936 [Dentipellis sp. KUC8613]